MSMTFVKKASLVKPHLQKAFSAEGFKIIVNKLGKKKDLYTIVVAKTFI